MPEFVNFAAEPAGTLEVRAISCPPAGAFPPEILVSLLLLAAPLADPSEDSSPQAASAEAPAMLIPRAAPSRMNLSREIFSFLSFKMLPSLAIGILQGAEILLLELLAPVNQQRREFRSALGQHRVYGERFRPGTKKDDHREQGHDEVDVEELGSTEPRA
jgi:hypothetical protein